MSETKVKMNIRGKARNVFLGNVNSDGSRSARLRTVEGNSIRGKVCTTSQGLRFYPANRELLNNL